MTNGVHEGTRLECIALSSIPAPGSLLFSNTKEIDLEKRHNSGEHDIEMEEDNKQNEIEQLQDEAEHTAIISVNAPESKSRRTQL